MTDKISFSIPKELVEKLKKRAEKTGFDSLSDYITYILRQVLSRIEAEESQKGESSEKKIEEVKQTLRDMGYID